MVDIECNIKFFVDDILVYIIVENLFMFGILLNFDFEKINEWLKKWLVFFNFNKMECMIIFFKLKKFFYFLLIFDDVYFKDVELYKYFGVIISSNLLWNLYINEILFKVYVKLGLMCKVKYILDRNSF